MQCMLQTIEVTCIVCITFSLLTLLCPYNIISWSTVIKFSWNAFGANLICIWTLAHCPTLLVVYQTIKKHYDTPFDFTVALTLISATMLLQHCRPWNSLLGCPPWKQQHPVIREKADPGFYLFLFSCSTFFFIIIILSKLLGQ